MSDQFHRMTITIAFVFSSFGYLGCSTVQDVAGKAGDKVGGSAAEETKNVAEEAASGDSEDASEDAESAGLSRKGENQIRAVERVREKCPLDTPPFEMDDRTASIYQCETKYDRVQKNLKAVPAKDRAHPKYAEAKKYVADLGEKIPEWKEMKKKREAQSEKQRKLTDAYGDERRAHSTILSRLWYIKKGEQRPETDAADIEREVKMAKKLDGFAKNCKEKYQNVDTYYGKDDYEHPSNSCELAQNWKKYFVQYLRQSADEMVKRKADMLKSAVEDLRNSGSLYGYTRAKLEDPAAFKKKKISEFKPLFEAVGIEFPAKKFDAIEKAAEGYESALKSAAKTNRWPDNAGHKDGSVKKAVANAVSAISHSFVRYGLTHDHWSVRKNSAGYPIKKLRDFYVMTKAKGEGFCRVYKGTAVSEYTGAGYTSPTTEVGGKTHQYLVSSCN